MTLKRPNALRRAASIPRRVANIPHLAALRHRDYRFTWFANMCSGAAMWSFIVAISWLILERSDRSGDVGIITFASMLPFLVVSPVAGIVADRFDRQTIARFTFLANMLVTAAVAALALTGALNLWHLAALTFISGSMRSAQEPAIASLIPNQVPREDLLNAITLNAATRHGARFFGLLVASPLLAIDAVGAPGVLALSAVFQAAGLAFMAMARTRSRGEATPRSGWVRSMWDGLTYIYTSRMISIFILLVAFHCALVMSYESILPVFSSDQLGADDGSILGYIYMGFGIGSLAAVALMAGVRDERKKGQWLLWTGVISGVGPILLAVTPAAFAEYTALGRAVAPGVDAGCGAVFGAVRSFPVLDGFGELCQQSPPIILAVAVSAVMGGAQSAFMALTNTYVQTIAPDRLRGRISSLYILHAGGIMAFANLGYGFIADAFSAPPILMATAAAFLLFLFSANASLPDLRRVYRTGAAAA